MPKVTARVPMRGVDLKQMMDEAKAKMADVAPGVPFKITDVQMMDMGEDLGTRQGMARMFACDMTMEADVPE